MVTANPNSRLETFCDAVFAIALTLLIINVSIPVKTAISTSADLWRALGALLPSIFAFVLSFVIIFITWANHHETMKLIDKTSHPFVYANGLLMLGVVFVPFPTALLGENLMTSHASPAVVLYSAADAIMGVGWAFIGWTALAPHPLTRDERATQRVRKNLRNSYFAIAFYTTCAIIAAWLPVAVAVVITVTWVYWVIYGIRSASESRSH